jgi:hypothetical protein
MSNYTVDVSSNGTLSWRIDIKNTDYDILCNFVNQIILCKFVRISDSNKWLCGAVEKTADTKSITDFKVILSKEGQEYFDIIKDFVCSDKKEEYVEIKIKNSYQRIVIYMICIIFGMKCSKVKDKVDVLVPCTIYLPCNKGKPRKDHVTRDFNGDELVCGCYYAPKSFRKHHHDNDYDDRISYSKFNVKMKVAVRVYKQSD